MKIHLDQLGDEPFSWQETLSLSPDELDRSEVEKLGEIRCQGKIQLVHPGYLLRADLEYSQTLSCMRCLAQFEMPVVDRVELLIQLDTPGEAELDHELASEDLGVLFLTAPELEIRPILIEQVHLGIPMKPLCHAECAGLCSQCGADLNTRPCRCKQTLDPRWAVLESLKAH